MLLLADCWPLLELLVPAAATAALVAGLSAALGERRLLIQPSWRGPCLALPADWAREPLAKDEPEAVELDAGLAALLVPELGIGAVIGLGGLDWKVGSMAGAAKIA